MKAAPSPRHLLKPAQTDPRGRQAAFRKDPARRLTKKGLVPRGAAAQACVELNPSGSGEGWVFNR